MSIQVRELPPYHVAYMRYVGPYGPHGIPELWMKFQKWMEARGLATDTAIKMGVGYDDPGITAAEKCRYDACVVVPQDVPSDKWVNVVDLPGGKVAVSEFMGGAHEIEEAWGRVFSAWLPGSGYQPDDRPCLEVYRGHAGVEGKPGIFRCELWLPVRPL
jgi:AraC family transcriptional regulator